MQPLAVKTVKQALSLAEARERNEARRHSEWRRMPQDILIVLTGIVEREAASAAERVARNAGRFGIAVRAGPERRRRMPRGHPPILGVEHVDPVFMTVTVRCSMAQVVELLTYYMPEDMSVVPIPRKRYDAWRRQAMRRRAPPAGRS